MAIELDQGTLTRLRLEGQAKSGASWFYWIAGLSLINTIVARFGSTWGFVIGLGITGLFDAIATQDGSVRIATLVLDLIVVGIFVMFGYFAHRRRAWSFMVGMILYGLDGLLLLSVREFVGAGFHAFALYYIFQGFQASRAVDRLPPPALTPVGAPDAAPGA